MELVSKVVSIDVNANIKKKDGSTYKGILLAYRDKDGNLKEKGFHENTFKFNKSLKSTLESLSAGDTFTATVEKEGEFWNWKEVVKGAVATSSSPVSSAKAPAASSTYSTAEERAQTQVYIVRQSSLTNALKLLEIQGSKKATPEDVINIAVQFEAWVLGKQTFTTTASADTTSLEDINDDLPF